MQPLAVSLANYISNDRRPGRQPVRRDPRRRGRARRCPRSPCSSPSRSTSPPPTSGRASRDDLHPLDTEESHVHVHHPRSRHAVGFATAVLAGRCRSPRSAPRRDRADASRRRRASTRRPGAHQPRPPRLAARPGHPPGPGGPHDLPARGRARRSACCGPTPSPTPTAATSTSAAAPTTRRPTPRDRARSTPTTSARAAVVYLRHWQATGSATSRRLGLRAAARPDLPADRRPAPTPATSCSGCSPTARSTRAPSPSSCPTRPTATRPTGWPARSGRSARATRPSARSDPAFAAFLRDRLDLAIDAVDRQVLDALRRATSTSTASARPPG